MKKFTLLLFLLPLCACAKKPSIKDTPVKQAPVEQTQVKQNATPTLIQRTSGIETLLKKRFPDISPFSFECIEIKKTQKICMIPQAQNLAIKVESVLIQQEKELRIIDTQTFFFGKGEGEKQQEESYTQEERDELGIQSKSEIYLSEIQLGPKNWGARIDYSSNWSMEGEEGTRTSSKESLIFWIYEDTINEILQSTSTTQSDTDFDSNETESFIFLSQIHDGFFDLQFTRSSATHSWPVDEHESDEETQTLRWDKEALSYEELRP